MTSLPKSTTTPVLVPAAPASRITPPMISALASDSSVTPKPTPSCRTSMTVLVIVACEPSVIDIPSCPLAGSAAVTRE